MNEDRMIRIPPPSEGVLIENLGVRVQYLIQYYAISDGRLRREGDAFKYEELDLAPPKGWHPDCYFPNANDSGTCRGRATLILIGEGDQNPFRHACRECIYRKDVY